jgi:signal transduction histidine kinase
MYGMPPIKDLGPEKVLNLMHILHEAVTNVIKHSGANTIIFRTGQSHKNDDDPEVFIEIEDNGKGFGKNLETNIRGRGIPNMHWRARDMNERLELFDKQHGAVVRILFMP